MKTRPLFSGWRPARCRLVVACCAISAWIALAPAVAVADAGLPSYYCRCNDDCAKYGLRRCGAFQQCDNQSGPGIPCFDGGGGPRLDAATARPDAHAPPPDAGYMNAESDRPPDAGYMNAESDRPPDAGYMNTEGDNPQPPPDAGYMNTEGDPMGGTAGADDGSGGCAVGGHASGSGRCWPLALLLLASWIRSRKNPSRRPTRSV